MTEEEVNLSFNSYTEPETYEAVCDCHHWGFWFGLDGSVTFVGADWE